MGTGASGCLRAKERRCEVRAAPRCAAFAARSTRTRMGCSACPSLLADELEVAEDHGQQIVEVVGDAAGELADRLHLLRFAQHPFGLGAFGHVGDGQHETSVGHRGAADLELMPV